MQASQWLRIALRVRRARILAMFLAQHSIHATHFCPNFYTVIRVLEFHLDVALAPDLSPNLLNDLFSGKIIVNFPPNQIPMQHNNSQWGNKNTQQINKMSIIPSKIEQQHQAN